MQPEGFFIEKREQFQVGLNQRPNNIGSFHRGKRL